MLQFLLMLFSAKRNYHANEPKALAVWDAAIGGLRLGVAT